MEINKESNSPSSVLILQDRDSIYTAIGDMIQESADVTYIVGTIYDMMKMYHVEMSEKIKASIRNGGEIRILTEICDIHTLSLIRRMGASETRITRLPYKGKMIVEKGRKLITSCAMNEPQNIPNGRGSMICVTFPGIVNSMFELCEHLWNTAQSPIIAENMCLPEQTSTAS